MSALRPWTGLTLLLLWLLVVCNEGRMDQCHLLHTDRQQQQQQQQGRVPLLSEPEIPRLNHLSCCLLSLMILLIPQIHRLSLVCVALPPSSFYFLI